MNTNDIYVCAFPKSGITFLGFLLAGARLHHNGIPLQPTLYNIDFLLIDTNKMRNTAAAAIWNDGVGNLYKTHNPFAPLPNVIYLLRNPVDALRSYFYFRRQLGSPDSAHEFLTGPEGINSWVHHVKSWLLDNRTASQSLFVTEYEALTSDPKGELQALTGQLGLTLSHEAIEYAVQAAGIQKMREMEAGFMARNPVYAQYNLDFIRKTDRRQVSEMTPELLDLIQAQALPVYESALERLSQARTANLHARKS